MFKNLREIFSGKDDSAASNENDDATVAVAALLVEAATADDDYTVKEKALIDRILVSEFGVEAHKASETRSVAERKQAEANDLHQFTKPVKALTPQAKISLIEGLWRIILSDEKRDPWEDALVRRVAGLLYVSDVESGAARLRVQKSMADGA